MESINHFTRLTAAFLGLTILVLGIAAIWLIRMRKKSLKTKKAETEERGLFSQTDELVPIDEIGPGFIVTNGGKKFIVVLKCGGSDFYTKPIGEKVRVKNNYAAFISEFTSRVTYRIYGEDINMDGTVREYERILTELQDMLFETNEDYKALRKEFETVRSDFDSIETRERSKQLLLLQKKIKAYSWRIRHVESQLAYIAKVSGPDAARQNLIQTYVVSWSAPPDLAAILTKEELYQEAAKHLKEDIKKLLHNLAECDVKAVPCSKAELFNMLHTHYHPISGNRFHFDDLLESNWDSRIMDNEQIASMKAEKQAIQAEQNEQKKRGDTPSADGYARIRELDQGIGEAEHSRSIRMEEQSRLRGENARTKEEIGRIDALSARARSAISPSRSSFGGGVSGLESGISQEEQEILDQYATIDNFESPQFKNISLERKAALYRERAAKTRVRGATTAAGTMAGMTFGATAGMAMTAFSSPAAKMQMTAIGGAMGANAGSILGEVMAEPVYEGGVELVRMGGPLLQKGATILKDKAEAYRNNPEGLNVYEEEPQKMLEVNVHSSSKPAVTTVSQSQDNNQSSVETVSGPGSKEQPSYQSEVEAVGKDAGAQSGPQVTYTETVSDEDAAIMQQFYEAEIQKPEFRRTMHHAYTDSAVSARQVYSGLKNSMVNATKEERAVANEQIIETAFMQYTNTILDSLDAPEHVDQITYQQAVEDRLREDERGRIEKYLRSKHLLF